MLRPFRIPLRPIVAQVAVSIESDKQSKVTISQICLLLDLRSHPEPLCGIVGRDERLHLAISSIFSRERVLRGGCLAEVVALQRFPLRIRQLVAGHLMLETGLGKTGCYRRSERLWHRYLARRPSSDSKLGVRLSGFGAAGTFDRSRLMQAFGCVTVADCGMTSLPGA